MVAFGWKGLLNRALHGRGCNLAKSRDPFGIVLKTLRERLRAGAYPGGVPLTITDLAQEFQLSPTPVREALSRLAGQGLVEDVPGKGYFVRVLQPGDLVELLMLHEIHVGAGLAAALRHQQGQDRSALTLAPPWLPDLPDLSIDQASRQVQFAEVQFEFTVLQAGNATLVRAHRRLADRLAPARRAELAVLVDVDAELGELAQVLRENHWEAAKAVSETYHRRRIAAAASIAAATRQTE